MNGVRVVPTDDALLIGSIINAEGVHEHMTQDGDGELPVLRHPSIYYLAAYREIGVDPEGVQDQLLGVMAFVPINRITWNPHIAVLPAFQGQGLGTAMMAAGMRWMFNNTPCVKLVAFPPEYNKAMVEVFLKCGFFMEGHSCQSILKNGVLCGRWLMGIEKEGA